MSSETPIPKEYAIVEFSPETNALVEKELSGESDEVKRETKALIEAIKLRAQSEAKAAGDFTRETYLNAVRQAKETIEQNQLIKPQPIEPERITESIRLIQMEAEKNWESIVKEVATLGDRLADAAKAAWDAFTAPRPHS